MKLGICYMVFDGAELLEFAARSIRNVVDHISVTYQTTSYFNNPVDDYTFDLLNKVKNEGLIDELIHVTPDFSVRPKLNELNFRNIGLDASIKAGCTHHISSDVDEFYKADELVYAKNSMEDNDYSMVSYNYYYKKPTFLVTPEMKYNVSFIHSVDNRYEINDVFPFRIEITRRLDKFNKCRVFSREEIINHHMSYVRRDIRRKLMNSDNGRFYKIDKFVEDFNKYELGNRLRIAPDFLNRRTVEVPNIFNIDI